jgi:hypothetical protein
MSDMKLEFSTRAVEQAYNEVSELRRFVGAHNLDRVSADTIGELIDRMPRWKHNDGTWNEHAIPGWLNLAWTDSQAPRGISAQSLAWGLRHEYCTHEEADAYIQLRGELFRAEMQKESTTMNDEATKPRPVFNFFPAAYAYEVLPGYRECADETWAHFLASDFERSDLSLTSSDYLCYVEEMGVDEAPMLERCIYFGLMLQSFFPHKRPVDEVMFCLGRSVGEGVYTLEEAALIYRIGTLYSQADVDALAAQGPEIVNVDVREQFKAAGVFDDPKGPRLAATDNEEAQA